MKTTIVKSAQYWMDAARAHQSAGRPNNALLSMENAFNHTESALAHIMEKVPGVKEEMARVEKISE
jgi:hypothetical protein